MDEIEVNEKTAEVITNVFFCDPYCSSQKAACERNHEFIRYVLPKGVSFETLTQRKLDLIFSNINSTPRRSIGGITPYALMKQAFGVELLDKLNIVEIKAYEVYLKVFYHIKIKNNIYEKVFFYLMKRIFKIQIYLNLLDF